jgi:hypothetical protein
LTICLLKITNQVRIALRDIQQDIKEGRKEVSDIVHSPSISEKQAGGIVRRMACIIEPVLTLQGGFIPPFGGNITMSSIEYGMRQLAQNVTAITVPNSDIG